MAIDEENERETRKGAGVGPIASKTNVCEGGRRRHNGRVTAALLRRHVR